MKIHKEEINKLLISVKDKQCGDLGMLICSGYQYLVLCPKQVRFATNLGEQIPANGQLSQLNKMMQEIKVESYEGNSLLRSSLLHRRREDSMSEEEFQPEYHQIKRLGLPFNKAKLKSGNWTEDQNLIYLSFLINNKNDFIGEAARRKKRIFFFMSKNLRRRTPDQCRSHHQKLQLKFDNDIGQLIDQLSSRLNINPQDLLIKPKSHKKNPDLSGEKKAFSNDGTGLTTEPPEKIWQKIKQDEGFLRISILFDYLFML